MDSKRFIFQTLSLISLILPIVVCYFIFYPYWTGVILGPVLIYSCYLLVQMISIFVWVLFFEKSLPDIDGACFFLLGIFLFGQKRIYYSDLGYFYMSGKSNGLTIWKQGFFYSEKLFKVHYGGDIEYTRTEIKSKLEKMFQDEIFENQRRKTLKDWNGCVDKESERDDKLNKILN